jgi:hypothetical protein
MTTKKSDRQYPLIAEVDLGIANMGSGNGCTMVLPPGALLLSVVWLTVTAFDSVTTATGTLTDGTTVFVNGVDVKTTGSETVANVPKFYPSGGTLTASLAETGATATVGRALVSATYYIVGRGQEQQF